jgi:CHAT domain-containing protein
MERRLTSFRLHVLGHRAALTSGEPLIVLGEFRAARAVERVSATAKQVAEMTKRVSDLRTFIEDGAPRLGRDDLVAVGSQLFQLLFRPGRGANVSRVRELFARAASPDTPIVPFEIFLEDYEMAAWPWEYVFDPTTRRFLCQEFHPISRGIFTMTPGRPAPSASSRLRVFLAIGTLPDDRSVDAAEQVRSVRDVFAAYTATGDVHVEILHAPSPARLDQELQRTPYDVVHYFGHAGYDMSRREGFLQLEQKDGRPFKFFANDFANLVARSPARLVFLNACDTGRTGGSTDPARSSLAAALLDRGVPAVIATQYEMPERGSQIFAAFIYNSLAAGKTLGESMQAGRQAMTYADAREFFDWGIPVLYTADPNVVVFTPGDDAKERRWVSEYERAVSSPDAIKRLAQVSNGGAPSLIAAETKPSSQSSNARVRVALADIDAKAAFLTTLAAAANRVQTYFHFELVHLPVPAGAVVKNFGALVKDARRDNPPPQFYLPFVDHYFRDLPKQFSVDRVICLTKHLVAGDFEDEDDEDIWWNLFSANPRSNKRVTVVSTYGLRSYARRAKVTYAKAVLFLAVGSLLEAINSKLEFHDETCGCPLDFCEDRDDIIVGLEHMRFDHKKCRSNVRDPAQLAAVDALLALEAGEEA